jgi:hypothetical protein
MVAEFLANDGSLPLRESERKELSIKELLARYWIAAKRSLQPDSLDPIKRPLKVLRRLYGDTLVEQFGPTQLKALRIEMDRMKWSRNGINEATRRIRTMFGWGVGEELVEPTVHLRLRGVRVLRKGEGGHERKRVMPVDPELVEKTLPFLPHDVRAMIELQLLTGAIRPSHVLGYTIPQPTLTQQRRIVDHLDAVAARVTHAAIARREALELKPHAVRSILRSWFQTSGSNTLGEWATVQSGYAFKSEWFSDDGIRLARNVNVGHGALEWTDVARIPSEQRREFQRFELAEGGGAESALART